MPEPAIRRATVEDAATIARLNVAVHQVHVDAMPAFFEPVDLIAFEPAFAGFLADAAWFYLIAEVAGAPVGYAAAREISYPPNPFITARAHLRLDQMAVLPEHEGKGYGRALVQAVRDLARTLGLDEIQLDVWSFNERAQRLYQGEGFETFRLEMRAKLDSPTLKNVE